VQGACEATANDAHGKPVVVLEEMLCLPIYTCDQWVGCAFVRGNEQNGWFVERAADVPTGQAAVVGNVCTRGTARCQAATVRPNGVACPPRTVMPLIDPPDYRCETEQGQCRKLNR